MPIKGLERKLGIKAKLKSGAQPTGEDTVAERDALTGVGHLRRLTDALPVLISYVDADHRYREANKVYEEWFGRPRSESLVRYLEDEPMDILEPEDSSWIDRALEAEEDPEALRALAEELELEPVEAYPPAEAASGGAG